jgi:hypothetical protein
LLITLQFPIIDGRAFANDFQRLRRPSWPLPRPDSEFVRCFGPIAARRRGAAHPDTWSDELYHASARNALRFTSGSESEHPSFCFRRLLFNGLASARVEIGIQPKVARIESESMMMRVIADGLDSHFKIRCADAEPEIRRLAAAGKSLADLYAKCTISRGDKSFSSLVCSGEPCVVVEYQLPTTPGDGVPDLLLRLPAPMGLTLSASALRFCGRTIQLWMIGVSPDATRAVRGQARCLRTGIQRIHSEHEVLVEILRMIGRNEVIFVPNTEAGNRLEHYLNDATRFLNRATNDDNKEQDIAAVILAYARRLASGEMQLIRSQLAGARRQIRNKLYNFLDREPPHLNTFVRDEMGEFIETQSATQGDTKVSITVINIGDNNEFRGDFIAGRSIGRTMMKAKDSEASEDVKNLAEQLSLKIAKLCELQLPPVARETARTLDTFVGEAMSHKPRPAWLEISGKGLIEAAKSVADISGPVIISVRAIMDLLKIPFV